MSHLLERLAEAAEAGELTAVKEVLAAGVPVDAWLTESRITALMLAIGEGQVEVAEFLLSQGASPEAADISRSRSRGNDCHTTAIDFVFNHDDPVTATRLFGLLLAHGVKAQSLLVSAVKFSPVPAVKLVLEAGADPNLLDEDGDLALYHAAKSSRMIKLLLRHGACVNGQNRYGSEAIHYACCWGWAGPVRTLLQHGADPNSLEVWEGSTDTPLYYAAGHGHLDTVQALLAAGADPNLSPSGLTPLMRAARHGSSHIVEALLKAGADRTCRDSSGRTALDFAMDWRPDLLTAALALASKEDPDDRVSWRRYPRKNQEAKLVVRSDSTEHGRSEREWTDGHGRVVALLTGDIHA